MTIAVASLPNAPAAYSQTDQNQTRLSLSQFMQQVVSAQSENGVNVVSVLQPSAVFVGGSSADQYGPQITLPTRALTGTSAVRVVGFAEITNASSSPSYQPVFKFWLGGTEVLTYTTGGIPENTGYHFVGFDWLIAPYCGRSAQQTHMMRLLDGGNVGRWDTLPVDLFAQAPAVRCGGARSAISMTQAQQLAVSVNLNGMSSALTVQFVGGTIEVLTQ